MGLCHSKQKYVEPSVGSESIIKLYLKADRDLVIKSVIGALNVIDNEELKKEYHYIRKLIIVSVFLKYLPKIFNNDY